MLLFASCTSMRNNTTTEVPVLNPREERSPRFIENIAINSTPTTSRIAVRSEEYKASPNNIKTATGLQNIEEYDASLFKYSILMNLPIEELKNEKLFTFLDEWYGTPYRYGGSSKSGIDCSAFTGFLMAAVYSVSIPRNSRDQFSICQKIGKNDLTEGDLVFFKTRNTISHVGVYLGNNKFAHASTSSGVMISDLDEVYFARKYAGSGRIK